MIIIKRLENQRAFKMIWFKKLLEIAPNKDMLGAF